MNTEDETKEKIKYIASSEGDKFEFDEIQIGNEFSSLQTEKSSLPIKILSIAGGFLSTLAFVGFLFISGLNDSEIGQAIVGLVSIGLAVWLNVAFNKLIIDTLSVSTYAIGLCLLAFGLGELNVDENVISILFIIISLIVLIITQNYILSFISLMVISGSLLFLIFTNDFNNLIHIYNAIVLFLVTYVFLNEAKFLSRNKWLSKLYNPLRISLIMSLLMGLLFVGKKELDDFSINYVWITSTISIPLIIYLISIVIKVLGISNVKTKIVVYALCSLMLLPTAFSPAISGSLLIILLSFLVNYKFALYTGIISFIYFVSQYYYDLNFTLLTKSILLFSSGLLFLLFYILTYKYLGSNEKV